MGTWTEARSKATFDVKKSRPREHHRDADGAQDALRLRSGQSGATRERFGGDYMWQASELALAVVLGGGAGDASGCAIRAETDFALGDAGDEMGDDAVADAGGDATGRGARLALARAELTEGSVSEFSVCHAMRDLFREVQDSSITSRAVGAGAASPDSIMKEVRARSRLTVPMPSEPLVPARISAIFTSRFFSASATSLSGGAAASGVG